MRCCGTAARETWWISTPVGSRIPKPTRPQGKSRWEMVIVRPPKVRMRCCGGVAHGGSYLFLQERRHLRGIAFPTRKVPDLARSNVREYHLWYN